MAILHLTAALSGKRHELPKPMIDACYFHIRYVGELEKKQQRIAEEGDLHTMDHLVFYGQ